MKSKKNVLYSLIIMPVAGIIYLPAQAQQKQDAKAIIYPRHIHLRHLIRQILPEQHPTIFSIFGTLTLIVGAVGSLKNNQVDNEVRTKPVNLIS